MTRPSGNPDTARIVAARHAEAQQGRARSSHLRDDQIREISRATVELCVELITEGPAHTPQLSAFGLRERRHVIACEIL